MAILCGARTGLPLGTITCYRGFFPSSNPCSCFVIGGWLVSLGHCHFLWWIFGTGLLKSVCLRRGGHARALLGVSHLSREKKKIHICVWDLQFVYGFSYRKTSIIPNTIYYISIYIYIQGNSSSLINVAIRKLFALFTSFLYDLCLKVVNSWKWGGKNTNDTPHISSAVRPCVQGAMHSITQQKHAFLNSNRITDTERFLRCFL